MNAPQRNSGWGERRAGERPRRVVAVNPMAAGLGNRIRFTLSAEVVARSEDRLFSYVWPTRPGLFEPAFTDLWKYPETSLPVGAIEPNLVMEKPHFGRESTLIDLRGMRNWFIRGNGLLHCGGDTQAWEDRFRSLVPVEEIKGLVLETKEKMPPEYVGIQVRASKKTHELTRKASPPSWFIGRMHEILADNPESFFYLSCDDPATEAHIRRSVANIIGLEKKGEYNSLESVRASVADLYLLSESVHILGPYWSSFVDLAWALGGRRQDLEDSRDIRKAGGQGDGPSALSQVFVRNPLFIAKSKVQALLGVDRS